MRHYLTGLIAGVAIACAAMAQAAPLKLSPANPQPGSLKKGLAVSYGYAAQGQDIKSLNAAAAVLKSGAERGRALKGLDHRDTNEGDKTLTSKRAMNVAASIRGYIRFDAPGVLLELARVLGEPVEVVRRGPSRRLTEAIARVREIKSSEEIKCVRASLR